MLTQAADRAGGLAQAVPGPPSVPETERSEAGHSYCSYVCDVTLCSFAPCATLCS